MFSGSRDEQPRQGRKAGSACRPGDRMLAYPFRHRLRRFPGLRCRGAGEFLKGAEHSVANLATLAGLNLCAHSEPPLSNARKDSWFA